MCNCTVLLALIRAKISACLFALHILQDNRAGSIPEEATCLISKANIVYRKFPSCEMPGGIRLCTLQSHRLGWLVEEGHDPLICMGPTAARGNCKSQSYSPGALSLLPRNKLCNVAENSKLQPSVVRMRTCDAPQSCFCFSSMNCLHENLIV